MKRSRIVWSLSTLALTGALAAGGCALRAADVAPLRTDPVEFSGWDCTRIEEEIDHVQRQATHVAYAFDERAGNNIIAMGLGLSVFWPALLTMRPQGPDATLLAALKGRHEALMIANQARPCPKPDGLEPGLAAALPVAVGDHLVYEQRSAATGAAQMLSLRVSDLRRDEMELTPSRAGSAAALWVTDRAGNLKRATEGPIWPSLLRQELSLGQTISGTLTQVDNSHQWARVRGQVVAVGPQWIGGRPFDVAVIELFGDGHDGERSARLDGVLVIDRASGLHLRLDLFCAHAPWQLQRRLVRLERQRTP
jgi:hypothetical protein